MTDRAQHIARARANREFADQLLSLGRDTANQPALNWAVTVAFYAALQYVEAFLADQGLHSANHPDRDQKMISAPIPQDVYAAYKMLKKFSEDARYYLADFPLQHVEQVVLHKYLARISRFADP